MPNNIEAWQVFEDDRSLQLFLENARTVCEDHSNETIQEDPCKKKKEDGANAI